jgi:hypothetical protein
MSILRSFPVAAVLCAAAVSACGGGSPSNTAATSTASTGGGATGTGGFTPAAHPSLPTVRNLGGPVLHAPKVQPIAYQSDPDLADIGAFLGELTKTAYWSDTTSEYGVGPLTVLPTIVRTEAAPAQITDLELTQALAANTIGTSPAWGAADPSTVYLFLIPPGTILSDTSGTGCTDYDGYHVESTVTGTLNVPYAAACACPGFDGKNVNDLQQRTVAISHELVEAATDPFPNANPAYLGEDNADIVWTITSTGEVADMCQFNSDSYAIPAGATYMVQRSWSNEAARSGTNPCVPVLTPAPYFNSVPVLPDMVAVQIGGPPVVAPGVKIPVGGSRTIDVTLFSDAPTSGPWKVSAGDISALTGGSKQLLLTLDKASGQNGDTLHLTIKVLQPDSTYGVEPFVLFSDDTSGQDNLWMGLVGQ